VLSERRQLPLADFYITSSLSTGPRIPKATTCGWGYGSETSEGTTRTPALQEDLTHALSFMYGGRAVQIPLQGPT
jgi:hypothetical protein